MENTNRVLFSEKENRAIWFIAINQEKWIGPLSASEVLSRIEKGELSWAHFAWRKDLERWTRICDLTEFQVAVPSLPNKIIEVEVRKSMSHGKTSPPSPPSKQKDQTWYLYYNESQFGPFHDDDIHRFLRIGKIHGDVYIWRDGMLNWEKIKKVDLFKESVLTAQSVRSEKKKDRRSTPRVPVIARSLMSSNGKVFAAVCRDVSIGGMQVLTGDLPGPVGTRLKLNISAPVTSTGKKIESFIAEGEIVRLLEDGKGFSFRFNKLSPRSVECIQAYIQSSEARK